MVEFINAQWSEVAGFIPAAFDNCPHHVAALQAQVERGEALCFLALLNGRTVGGVVLDGSPEAIRVLAMAGEDHVGLIPSLDAWVRAMARAMGIKRVIAHTTRPGMVVQAARHGWALDIATMSVEV